MNMASTIASRWAVSTRTRGEVQTASVSTPALELVLLGLPAGFSVAEAEGWMRDLAGVAIETSREDTHGHAIPVMLHHALTGLLFSQAELWSQPDGSAPCSVAFVDSGEGAAFGWVGEARVQVIVDGAAYEPQWVIVRDPDGRSARAAVLPVDRAALLGIEFWPHGEDGSEAPVAIEAEWIAGGVERASAIPEATEMPSPLAHAEQPAESAAAVAVSPPAPASSGSAALPLQQPGLATPPHEQHAEAALQEVAYAPQSAPASATDEGLVAAECGTMLVDDAPGGPALAADFSEAAQALAAPRAPHPVGRWLGRLLGFGRKTLRPSESDEDAGGTPVSAYDSLLSQSVPPTVLEGSEQTTLDLPMVPPMMLVEPDAPDFEFAGEEAAAFVAEPAMATVAAGLPPEPAVAEVAQAPPAPLEAPLAPAVTMPPVMAERVAIPVLEVPLAPAAATGPHTDVARAMNEVDAATLPVLPAPPVAQAPADATPLRIDREPVGADAGFAIPRLPERPAAPTGPPVLRLSVPPRAPEPAVASEQAAGLRLVPATSQLEPVAPLVLRAPVPEQVEVPAAPPVLRVGVPVRAAEAPPMLRVIPAPAPPSATVPPSLAAPLIVDTFAAAAPASPAVIRPAWPVLEVPSARRVPRRAWMWGGVVAAVFAAGWLLGVITNPTRQGEPGPVTRMLRAVGLAAPHYVAAVNSTPNGAWIAVDGKDVARRTPAAVELSPGPHTITLSLPELGSTQVQVRGAGGEKLAINPSLNGGLEVYSSDARVPISVTLDGREIGYAPVRLESVVPGLHELQFTGPGMPAWAQTVQVGVRRTAQVVAHPMSAPANGVVQVQATLNDERGASPLSGAQVWVDGQVRGVSPASLELPRGPHSLKLTWHGETAPVQVIDLPGGNRRFASFAFGLDTPSPQVVLLGGVHPGSANEQVVLSATLTTLQVGDVREAWLHVSTPEGLWRRYPMTAMRGARGPVLVCVFPTASLADGSARWYVSASTLQGDEYFSEMQVATVGGGAATRPRKHEAPVTTP